MAAYSAEGLTISSHVSQASSAGLTNALSLVGRTAQPYRPVSTRRSSRSRAIGRCWLQVTPVAKNGVLCVTRGHPPQMCHHWLLITAWDVQQHFTDFSLCVTVLANVVYSRKSAQDEMQALGGVELMLAHCQVLCTLFRLQVLCSFKPLLKCFAGCNQVDDESPFLREAALWGIRNLCEGNTSIQKQIDELQVIGTVDSPELQQAGVQVQLDPATGKLKLIDMHT